MMQRDDLLAVTTRTPVQDTSEAAVERPSASAGLPSELSFVFEHWPGAVLHASPEGTYRPVNELGHSFISLLRRLDDDPLNGLLSIAMHADCGVTDRLELTIEGSAKWFECIVIPVEDRGALVLARDDTYDVNIRRALFDSRQRYRDIVTISSDFAWETDASGALVFVSPHGALGYSAEELIGRTPADLLVDPDEREALLPFATREPIVETQLWLRDANGGETCLIASSVPVFDQSGNWSGARGLCRDVTRERLRDSELACAKVREQVVAYVVNQVREEARPQAMLDAAVTMLGRATSSFAVVYSRVAGGDYRVAANYGECPDGSIVAEFGKLFGEPGSLTINNGPYTVLARAALYHGEVNGIVALVRPQLESGWDSEDDALLEAVAGQLAIALRQVADQEEFERLSRIDALTGLMNRRAFEQELVNRLAHAERSGRGGTLLYVDLDNFKAINDNFGHQGGDDALQEVARTLLTMSRSYDLVARLGGDEFVVWFEETGVADGCSRAQDLIDAFAGLKRFSGADLPPLGGSVGVAPSRPGDGADIRDILGRADRAMYAAKRNGKSAWALADDTQTLGDEAVLRPEERGAP